MIRMRPAERSGRPGYRVTPACSIDSRGKMLTVLGFISAVLLLCRRRRRERSWDFMAITQNCIAIRQTEINENPSNDRIKAVRNFEAGMSDLSRDETVPQVKLRNLIIRTSPPRSKSKLQEHPSGCSQ